MKRIIPAGFFLFYFLYFAIFNRYEMAYQEQIHFFRYDLNYFMDFLSKPGGLSEYLGEFLIQFYLYPLAGAIIITLLGITSFILTSVILKKYGITGAIWAYVPALLIFILQNDYIFNPGYLLGFFLVLIYFSVYIALSENKLKYLFGFAGWILLYLATGTISLIGTLLCIMDDLLRSKQSYRYYIAIAFFVLAAIIPYLSWRFIFIIPLKESWLDPGIISLRNISKYSLLLLLFYIPLLIILVKIFPQNTGKYWFQHNWNRRSVIAATLILISFSAFIKKYLYDPELRLFFKIDHYIQRSAWDDVIEFTSQYAGSNHLILYYINLSLYHTGHLGDHMFNYSQIGIPGLWLNREGDENSLFLGSEIFYHLGDINEAYRWAFDAMVAQDQSSPRLLKQLVLTSLINGQLKTAEKYINILDQSIFYRSWSKKYRRYVHDPGMLSNDPRLAAKCRLLIHDDFLAGSKYPDIGLKQLLENHPDNRMAFEYYMSSLLLNKALGSFTSNIHRLKDFGYKEIPVHYEEALLFYMNVVKRNLLPPGYGIRKTTVERFRNYAEAYSSYTGDPSLAAQSFSELFGDTYWFYLHFINNQNISDESDHPFN